MKKTRSAGRFCATTCVMVMAAAFGSDVGASPRDAAAVRKLENYCAASWRNARIRPQDWDDCTQEAFAELLQRVKRIGLSRAIEDARSDERRELNRSIWCVAQRWRRQARYAHLPNECGQNGDPTKKLEDRETVDQLLGSACLRPLQREILKQWSRGQTVAEISRQLKLKPAQVSDEKYRAIRSLRKYWA